MLPRGGVCLGLFNGGCVGFVFLWWFWVVGQVVEWCLCFEGCGFMVLVSGDMYF